MYWDWVSEAFVDIPTLVTSSWMPSGPSGGQELSLELLAAAAEGWLLEMGEEQQVMACLPVNQQAEQQIQHNTT